MKKNNNNVTDKITNIKPNQDSKKIISTNNIMQLDLNKLINNIEPKQSFQNNCSTIKEYCYIEDQNFRGYMEDYCKIIENYNNSKNNFFCLIADGHGGDDVAIYLKDNFPNIFKEHLKNHSSFEKAAKLSFNSSDKNVLNLSSSLTGSTLNILYINFESDIISGDKYIINCANVGDSRTVLVNENKATRLSYDHKASDLKEKARIEKEGGFVANGRLLSQLALSRSIGDIDYKSYGLSSEPYIVSTTIRKDSYNHFIVMASDGIWDCVEDYELVNIIKQSNLETKIITESIVSLAKKRGSLDNISCIVIKLY